MASFRITILNLLLLSFFGFRAGEALARTVAEQSIRDVSGVLNQSITPNINLNSTDEDCNKRPEDYRVDVAAIFGENSLGAMTELGILNQCFSGSPGDDPPTGRFIVRVQGREYKLGTGDTVASPKVSVTNAHVLLYEKDENGNRIVGERPPYNTEDIFFRVYEGTPQNCRQVDYPVKSVAYGTYDPAKEPENDFAVVTLGRPVNSYQPLELASEELVQSAMAGEEDILMVGFSKHSTTNNGENYSASVCRGQLPPPGNYYHGNSNLFVHDCDTEGRGSGSSATVVKPMTGFTPTSGRSRYIRYFVGLHKGHFYDPSVSESDLGNYDPRSNYNLGITLNNPRLRAMIEDAAREQVASID